jgi:hypothetical protein
VHDNATYLVGVSEHIHALLRELDIRDAAEKARIDQVVLPFNHLSIFQVLDRAMDDLAADDLAVAKYRASHGESSQEEVHGHVRGFGYLKTISGVIERTINFARRSIVCWNGRLHGKTTFSASNRSDNKTIHPGELNVTVRAGSSCEVALTFNSVKLLFRHTKLS